MRLTGSAVSGRAARTRVAAFLAALLCAAPAKFDGFAQERPGTREISEKLVSEVDFQELIEQSFLVSHNGRRVGYRIHKDGKQLVVVDGAEGKQFDEVGIPVFSADSRRVGYIARDGVSWGVVLDDSLMRVPDTVTALRGLRFTPDGKEAVYTAELGGKQCVVAGGKRGKLYDAIEEGSIVFRPDTPVMAYAARESTSHFVVNGGVEGKGYAGVANLALSPDGKRMIYSAEENGKRFVVIDGREEKPYDLVTSLLFSPDGRHAAYVAVQSGKWCVVLDGVEQKLYDAVTSLMMSPDGKRLAYGAQAGETHLAVVDGVETGAREGVLEGSVRFSPDSRHLAYEAEGPADEFYMVLDGKEGKHYEAILANTIMFSPDGTRMVYVAEREGKRLVVMNEAESMPFDYVFTPVFSPGAKRLAFTAQQRDKFFVVVDGKKGDSYDGMVGEGVVFDSDDSLHYLVLNVANIHLMEERIR